MKKLILECNECKTITLENMPYEIEDSYCDKCEEYCTLVIIGCEEEEE